MANTRALRAFPRRGHSRMPAAKRERCGPRGGALGRPDDGARRARFNLANVSWPACRFWVNSLSWRLFCRAGASYP